MEHPDQVFRFEGPNLKSDGTSLEISTVCFAIRDGEGKVIATCAIQRDVTERKRAEHEAALLAAIVNASDDAIISFSRDLKITSWNAAAERIYGYSVKEAVGSGFDLFVPARPTRAGHPGGSALVGNR